MENTRTVLGARQIIEDASFQAQKLSQALVSNNARIHTEIKMILARKKEIDSCSNFIQEKIRIKNEAIPSPHNVTQCTVCPVDASQCHYKCTYEND